MRFDSTAQWFIKINELSTDIVMVVNWGAGFRVKYTLTESDGLVPFINHKIYKSLDPIPEAVFNYEHNHAGEISEMMY